MRRISLESWLHSSDLAQDTTYMRKKIDEEVGVVMLWSQQIHLPKVWRSQQILILYFIFNFTELILDGYSYHNSQGILLKSQSYTHVKQLSILVFFHSLVCGIIYIFGRLLEEIHVLEVLVLKSESIIWQSSYCSSIICGFNHMKYYIFLLSHSFKCYFVLKIANKR